MSGQSWIAVCVSERSFQPTPVRGGARSVGCWCALWTRGGNVSPAAQPTLQALPTRQKAFLTCWFVSVCFFFLISATGLNQYRKFSVDSALLSSRNPTCFFIWGFVVFCSVVWSTVCTPAGSDSPAREREWAEENLVRLEFSCIFCFPPVHIEGQAAVEGFSPAPISKLQYPTVLGLGLTSQCRAKLLFTPKQSFEQLMSHSCSAFLKVLVISPVTRIFWSTLNFWCWKIDFPVI